jgi:uncharacterized membrane protein
MIIALLVICFSLYSFLGWVIEVVYRSSIQKTFVNAGFLQGFFVPIYGVVALFFVALDDISNEYPLIIQFILYVVVASALEYIIGLFAEKILHVQLWSYSDNRFNLHGRICLKYSLIWGGLGVFFIEILHPFVWEKLILLNVEQAYIIASILAVYFIIDFAYSISLGRKLGLLLETGYQRIITSDPFELEKWLRQEKRLVQAFSNIRKNMSVAISKKFENNLGVVLEQYKSILSLKNIDVKFLDDIEYIECVKDILEHPEFLKTKNFKHHQSSIFDHVLKVSFLAYKISRQRGWDYRSAARGGLLHDFFLYDWRDGNDPGRPTKNFHGFRHSKVALDNSLALFELNKVEQDIIIKHMWPLTPRIPKYKESFLVVFLDKYVATYEFWNKPKKK